MISADRQEWAFSVVRPLYKAAARCERSDERKELVRRAAILEVRLLEGESIDALLPLSGTSSLHTKGVADVSCLGAIAAAA